MSPTNARCRQPAGGPLLVLVVSHAAPRAKAHPVEIAKLGKAATLTSR